MNKRERTYGRLFLRNIDQRCADGGREDHISMTLFLEDLGGGLGSVECSIKIDSHDVTPLFTGVILGGNIGRDSGVDYNDVKLSEIIGDLLNDTLDLLLLSDIGLVRGSFNIVGRCDLAGDGVGLFGSIVDQRDLFISSWSQSKVITNISTSFS